MRNGKLSAGDVMKVVEAFTQQSENNVAFGVLAETKHARIAAFVKGEELDILSLLTLQMAKDEQFKSLLFKAVELSKVLSTEEIIKSDEKRYFKDYS